ncbi:acetate/propionate family kinase [Phenylobacterium sp.]|uniref:acetate/propionate family kinase n=1 Tax=Phenylobacterium sp. TaxID=1871053 RepID=UPI0035675E19
MKFDGSVLALNAGSSSLKFGLFCPAEDGAVLLRGEIEEITTAPRLLVHDAEGGVLADRRWRSGGTPGFGELLEAVLDVVERNPGPQALAAVGHRVVHGGADHGAPARITPALLVELEALTSLDPLHMPHCLAPMRAIASIHPGLPQVACFDTAFHHTMPAVATRIAVPRALAQLGLRRYGFHGLSYDYVAGKLGMLSPALARGRVIVAHLGSGASLCALLGARSIATTMGFSVLDGLVMATRCGSLDPGVILYLGRQGHSFADIETLLYAQSGLLGVSGFSGDMQALLTSSDPRAREAIDLFTYRVATETGALVSALGGLDGLVFTAGIGEHAPAIRAEICARLAWLGLRLDEAANAAGLACISAPDSKIEVRVIATDEEAMIARLAQSVLQRRRAR